VRVIAAQHVQLQTQHSLVTSTNQLTLYCEIDRNDVILLAPPSHYCDVTRYVQTTAAIANTVWASIRLLKEIKIHVSDLCHPTSGDADQLGAL